MTSPLLLGLAAPCLVALARLPGAPPAGGTGGTGPGTSPVAAASGGEPRAANGSPEGSSDGTAAGQTGDRDRRPGEPADAGAAATLREAAIAALRRGDDARAHALVERLLVDGCIARARAAIAADDPERALVLLDEGLAVAPHDVETLVLRGETCLDLGRATGNPDFLADGRADLLRARAEGSLRGLLGASRAARLLDLHAEALALARAGLAALARLPAAEAAALRAALPEPPERTWAAAACRALEALRADAAPGVPIEARAPGPDAAGGDVPAAADGPARPRAAAVSGDPQLAEARREAREALAALLGRHPESVWAWTRTSWLEETGGDPDAALRACRAGLALLPEADALHAELARVGRLVGGRQPVLAAYAELLRRAPGSPTTLWHASVERFEAALDALDAGEDPRASFVALEADFRRCRTLAPARRDACIGYELLCRAGLGWCRLGTGDLAGAREAFQSMEDLAERGMLRAYPDRLSAGVLGLEAVAREYARATDDADSLGRAAAIYDYLRVYEPRDAGYAASAGFLNRDTAVVLEQEARRAARLAADPTAGAEERARAAQVADRRYAEAHEIMERSLAAYRDAARLAPDDVRILGDTGHVLTHYLWRDVEAAERYLRRAIELGAERLADPELDPDRRYELENAWGDAYRNLGFLYLTQKRDPVRAREYLLESVSIGPDPRPRVTGELLPDCDRLEAGDTGVVEKHRWGRRPR